MHLPDRLYALTIRNPWASAIASGQKLVENRSWMSHHRGMFAIHSSASPGTTLEKERAIYRVAAFSGLDPRTVAATMQPNGAVLAVARLERVCSDSRLNPYESNLRCDCGPWAMPGQRHFILSDVRKLKEPVPCTGFQRFWTLPDAAYAAVRDQLEGARA